MVGSVRTFVLGGAGRVEYQAIIALANRSPTMTAICALAAVHSHGGIFQSFSARFKTRNRSFRAASSLGKCPLALTALQIPTESGQCSAVKAAGIPI